MKKVKIALCQMNVIDNKKENISKAIKMIKKAKKQEADIAILPEMFNCPYENEKFIEYGEILEESETIKEIVKIAKENKIHVLSGSIPEKEKIVSDEKNSEKIENSKCILKRINSEKNKNEFNYYNTSVLIDDDGKILGKHRKMHLFDIDVPNKIYFKESDTLTQGNKFTIINTKFGKIGIGICYDIRFPELARIMALEGAEILIYPGAFNLTTGPAHWELLFRSRAVDNQVFTIGVSPALNKESNYNAYGHSLIVNPWGEVISKANFEEELIIQEINLEEVAKVKEEIPVLKNRRTDLYSLEKVNK